MSGRTSGRLRRIGDAMPLSDHGGRFCSSGKLSRGVDAMPLNDPGFGTGKTLCAVFRGDGYVAEEGDDGTLRICRTRGELGEDKVPVCVFTQGYEAATDNNNDLGIYRVDPHALPRVTSHDRPRPIEIGSPRDTRDNARKTLQAIQRRNEQFWRDQNKDQKS